MSGSGIHGVRQPCTSPVTSGTAGKTTFVMIVKVICSMIDSEYISIVGLFAYICVSFDICQNNIRDDRQGNLRYQTESVMIERKYVSFVILLSYIHVFFDMFVVPGRPLLRTNPLKSLGRARRKCSPGIYWRQIRPGCHTQRVLPNPC